MKISEPPFFKTTPLFYQTLPFYGKNLNPPLFLKILKIQTPFYKGGVSTCHVLIIFLNVLSVLPGTYESTLDSKFDHTYNL